MTDRVARRLEQSAAAIEGARRDLAAGAFGLTVERAYYAMFYVADALLAALDLSFRSHGAVHGAFGKEFGKTGLLDSRFHRWLLDAYDERQSATYGLTREMAQDRASELVAQAQEFLDAARAYLRR